MLIRNQNKDTLINLQRITAIFIECINGFNYVCVADRQKVPHQDKLGIGKYSTEEKAKKVLDMIEKEYSKYLTVSGGRALPTIHNIPKVFQMPKEEEI